MPSLEYAPKPHWHRTRTTRRVLIWLALSASVILFVKVTLVYGPRFHEWLRIRRLTSACLDYTPPSGRIVYDDDPSNNANAPGERVLFYTDGRHRLFVNPAFRDLNAAFGTTTISPAFVHERYSPSGNRRLAAVLTTSVTDLGIIMAPWITAPSSPATDLDRSSSSALIVVGDQDDHCTIYDGRIDPTNRSRFTIAVSCNGTSTIVDGELCDDDWITLMPRGGKGIYNGPTLYWCPPGTHGIRWITQGWIGTLDLPSNGVIPHPTRFRFSGPVSRHSREVKSPSSRPSPAAESTGD